MVYMRLLEFGGKSRDLVFFLQNKIEEKREIF